MTNAEKLAKAVLLFWEPGPWTHERRTEWLAITGTEMATSKVLGNLARKVAEEEELKSLGLQKLKDSSASS